ncbi:Haloacid dehalogenase domain protein hydrolase [Coriobacterium glomerans PW2]|uniref:Haloacid dehalogenase domain protein hydrolase n=1 Tax=Coriobacterium glomerans (strain ATCC 49209 / DSM 20642 / JCM 10262 / PW2) TaxID=700015 RepID=F2N8C4_CORGP|nr:HAD family hydrolase [Coriobacterium glomerans]AEB07307.1 Haloacid dehalogenase domain protein hydrolase [Coriobacterium glomerans PW2]
MLKAVLFDMDNTLLSINLSAFLAVFARDEAYLLADIARKNPFAMIASFGGALLELNSAERDDDLGNLAYFNRSIERRCGIPLDDPVIADVLESYEREILPRKNDSIIAARPAPGAREAIEAVLERGLDVALFTNPSFTRQAIACRIRWGELDEVPFRLITSMETSTRCKPHARYYLEGIRSLGLAPADVLMVGNDPRRDFPVPDCGIQTAYVGSGSPVRATWTGRMADFAQSFGEIEERFCERQSRDLLDIVQDVGCGTA